MDGEPNKSKVETTTTTETEKAKVDEVDYKSLYESEHADKMKIKSRCDELCTEIKGYKDREFARLSDDEKAKVQREQEIAHIKELEAKVARSEKESSLLNAGFSKEEIGQLMENDSPATYNKIMQDRIKAQMESAKLQNIVDTTITPNSSNPKEKRFSDYSMKELTELQRTNPEKYKSIMNSK